MALPYPQDPASPSAPNPYFPDNGFVRGDQFRANNGKIWANTEYLVTELAAQVAAILAQLPRGLIIGGVIKDGNDPPTVLAGSYDVKGTIVQVSANTALSWLTNSLGDTAIANDYWYFVGIKSGSIKVHLAWGDSVLGSTAIQKITAVGGGIWELGVLNAVDLSTFAVGMVVPTTGTPSAANTGVWESTAFSNVADSGGAGLKYIRVRNSNGVAQAAAGGNLTAYYRVGTVTTAADTRIYSPSPTFSATYGEYLSDYDSSYRLIAMFSSDGSGNVADVIPFGSGARKNDDLIQLATYNTHVNNALRFSTVVKNRGSSLTYSDDGTNAAMITANRPGWLSVNAAVLNLGGANELLLFVNGATTDADATGTAVGQSFVTTGQYDGAGFPEIFLNPGDYVRLHAPSALSGTTNACRLYATFRPAD